MTANNSKPNNNNSTPDVKYILTFTFKTSSKSLQQKFYEIIFFLTEKPESYAKQISDYYNRDRREYLYSLRKLVDLGIIEKVGERSSCVSYSLNQDVKKHVKKITQDKENTNVKKSLGGVSSSTNSSVSGSSGSPDDVKQMSKNEINNSLVYRYHRHTAYCSYVQKSALLMSKSKFKNNRYQESIHLLSGDYDVEYTKNFVTIRGPVRLGTLNEFELLKQRFILELAKVGIVIERRHNITFNLEEVLTDTQNKFEIACQDPFHKWFVQPFIDKNITVHEQDFSIDASLGDAEVDLIENWSMGEGVRKYQSLLDLSDNLLPIVDSLSQISIETRQTLSLMHEGQQEYNDGNEKVLTKLVDRLDDVGLILKDIYKERKDMALIIQDMRKEQEFFFESLRAEIQQSRVMTVTSESKILQIKSHLEQKEYSQLELALEMGYTHQSGISKEIKELMIRGHLARRKVKGVGRGRPTYYYKLGGDKQ